MQGRAERVVRGTLIGSASVVLAAVGHAVAGGGVPGWLALVAGLVGASLVGALLVGRRPSPVRTGVVVLVGQAGFHYLFAGLGGPGVDVATAHVHSASGALAVHAGAHAHAAHLTDPRMLAAHALAAVVTLVLLRYAESAVWGMLHRVLARVLSLAGGIAPDPARRTPVVHRLRTAPRRSAHPPPPGRAPPLASPA